MMDVNALIETQLRLECKGVNAEGLLVRIPGPNPDDIPRCLVVRHRDGYRLFFRHDLSRDKGLGKGCPPQNPTPTDFGHTQLISARCWYKSCQAGLKRI
jgi:hypothetical protein